MTGVGIFAMLFPNGWMRSGVVKKTRKVSITRLKAGELYVNSSGMSFPVSYRKPDEKPPWYRDRSKKPGFDPFTANPDTLTC